MKKGYEPKNTKEAVGHLIEECGEVVAAAGKSLRFGLHSVNPEMPPSRQETNRVWLLRELRDLKKAIEDARQFILEGDDDL